MNVCLVYFEMNVLFMDLNINNGRSCIDDDFVTVVLQYSLQTQITFLKYAPVFDNLMI